MRHFDKNCEHDLESLAQLNAEPWQVDLLRANPGYASWGPYEDHMSQDGEGWSSRKLMNVWDEFKDWKLDDLNECVNFYFELNRESVTCTLCEGEGYHPYSIGIARTFYPHQAGSEEAAWHDKIVQEEADALIENGRIPKGTSAEEVNEAQRARGKGFGLRHDAINRYILINTRIARLGLPKDCPDCNGKGYVFTAPKANVSLVLWMLHPRKGCSRGVQVKTIEQQELPSVLAWLDQAAQRNARRFEGLKSIAA